MPLSPYRVLDLCDERGQLTGQMLAQLGAEVIAIEPPGGSPSRSRAPFAHDEPGPENSLIHRSYNRGKRSVVLDLVASDAARDRFRQLVAGADVVIESGAPGALAKLGLAYDDLATVNPALVMASITAFGQTGPKANWAASDLTVWASSGSQAIAGDADRAPLRISVPQAFLHGSAEAAGAILIALLERNRSGLGQHVDVSSQQAAAQATQSMILNHLANGTPVSRRAGGLMLGGVFVQLMWPCKDGYVSITFLFGTALGVFTQKLMAWICEEGFCDVETRDVDWIDFGTRLFSDDPAPKAQYEEVKAIVEGFCKTKTKLELLDGAMLRGCLIAPIAGIDDVLALAQLASREFWDDVDGVKYPGPFGKMTATPVRRLPAAPRLGADTEAVLNQAPRHVALPGGVHRQPAATGTGAGTGAGPGRALDGVKILDLMWVMAGPAGSRVLTDHGATDVRIESSSRVEVARTLQPFQNAVPGTENSILFASLNAGKLGVTINLATVEGKAVIHDLIRWADVVLESFSSKAMKGFGLDYEAVRAINPRVVMLSSCLFGQFGPLSRFAGFGTMAAAISGFFGITGWPDRAPSGPYGAYTDYIAPRFANALLLAAVDHQQRTGEGQYIDYAQAEGSLQCLAPAILEYGINGRIWGARGNSDSNFHPHGVFPSAGHDQWVAIACETDRQRDALRQLIAPTAGGEPSDDVIAVWTSRRSPDDATLALQAVGVASHPVQNSAECSVDPQLLARNHFVSVPHADHGEVTIEGARFVLSRTPAVVANPGPTMGQHTYEVLTEILGYDADRFSDLLVAGALE